MLMLIIQNILNATTVLLAFVRLTGVEPNVTEGT